MKSALGFLAAAAGANAAIQQCSGNSFNELGNWFCGKVNQILYENVGNSGTYQAITGLGDSPETCGSEQVTYSGPLAPLDEGVSLHFRGPMNLAQVAVYKYTPQQKRSAAAHTHARRHAHLAHHQHQKRTASPAEKRDADMVVAVIDGQTVSWENNYFGPTDAPVPPAPPPPAPPAPEVPDASVDVEDGDELRRESGPPKFVKSQQAPQQQVGSDYTRVGYYNADEGVCDGVTFLGNYGGEGSGVFDYIFGNSLSYLNAEGTGGSSSPQCLSKTYIPSNKEFSIWTDQKCDGTCGFSRADDVAFKGFEGADKVFLFEFNMPLDGQTGMNGDMPAIWTLNGRISRTGQYSKCSCWETGCGEFDNFEVLMPGDLKCKTTFHTNTPGGSSDYLPRPTGGHIKLATVFDSESNSVSVKIVPDSVSFAGGLSREVVKTWMDMDADDLPSSLFQLTG